MSKDETIKVKNIYFEQILIVRGGQPTLSKAFQSLRDKDVFPKEFKPRYWLSRCLDKAIQELNHYLEAKRDLIKRHATKYEKDGKETDKDGKVIREWKKGDLIIDKSGEPEWKDFELYQKELNELQEIEVDFGFKKIVCDWSNGPDVNQNEMLIIIPFLAEPVDLPKERAEVVPINKKRKNDS